MFIIKLVLQKPCAVVSQIVLFYRSVKFDGGSYVWKVPTEDPEVGGNI
jgi:hypothetical protein